ncbi:MAG: DNA polymerase III subunit beta [Turneriella sp.]|nr:DNA polymerase III subunit beta [Leptospiraceae bacterium]MCX7633403.1 DNA polymerase III subunit beta [Turneriella sp.]
MRFETDKELIEKAIRRIDSIVPNRDTAAIVSNFLISLEPKTVRITASDMETTACITIPAQTQKNGEFIVPGKRFLEFVSSLISPELIVEVQQAEDPDQESNFFRVVLSGRGGIAARYVMSGNTAEHFPALQRFDSSRLFNVPTALLAEMIRKTQHSISQEDNRYIYNGLCFQSSGDQLTLVGTDGRRLAAITRRLPEPANLPQDSDTVVHAKAIREIQKLLDISEVAMIGVAEREFLVQVGDAQLSTRLLEGKFPDYKKVIPKEMAVELELSREKLTDALLQIRPVTEPPSQLCRMLFDNKTILLTAQSANQGSQVEVTLDTDYTGEKVELGLNVNFLLDVLKVLDCPRIRFSFTDSNKPVVIRDQDDPDFLSLIMPIKI